jgi:uncharacterized membrane protein YfcA
LRGTVKWRGSPVLIAGGLFGILPAFYLLHAIDIRIFRIGFGVFLAAYAAYMLLRPAIARGLGAPHRLRDAAIGFGGGLIGGLTAMPGALPTMWCELRGVPKDQQRGFVQPYITAMQLSALAVMFWHNTFSSQALLNLTYSLPALAAGAALGVIMFRKVDDAMFRHAVLAVLFVAGLALIV